MYIVSTIVLFVLYRYNDSLSTRFTDSNETWLTHYNQSSNWFIMDYRILIEFSLSKERHRRRCIICISGLVHCLTLAVHKLQKDFAVPAQNAAALGNSQSGFGNDPSGHHNGHMVNVSLCKPDFLQCADASTSSVLTLKQIAYAAFLRNHIHAFIIAVLRGHNACISVFA